MFCRFKVTIFPYPPRSEFASDQRYLSLVLRMSSKRDYSVGSTVVHHISHSPNNCWSFWFYHFNETPVPLNVTILGRRVTAQSVRRRWWRFRHQWPCGVKSRGTFHFIFWLQLLLFAQNACISFCIMWWPMTCVRWRRHRWAFVVHHKVSGIYIDRTVWPGIAHFYRDIHTDLLYSHTRYQCRKTSVYLLIKNETYRTARTIFESTWH